jgi:anthranilate synthase component 1
VEGVSGPVTSNFTQAGYEEVVIRAKEYIRAGDVIQVVLAQRFELPLAAAPFNVYRCLRTVNPSPYMFFLALGDHALAGASPEVMARVEGGEVTLRPIAGTRPRGTTEQDDVGLATELAANPKELAEHVMLLDLGRNDVGRVAEIGTVAVTERFVIERYSHVMHLVSNVRGRLAPGRDCFDALRAAFPAGTLTGAPKIRAMEIIEELEPVRRGVYGGRPSSVAGACTSSPGRASSPTPTRSPSTASASTSRARSSRRCAWRRPSDDGAAPPDDR